MKINGIIIKAISGFYYISAEERLIECKARGKLRLLDTPPLVGDLCEVETDGGGCGTLTRILPRRNFLMRPPVANVEKLCVICSRADPITDLFLIDKICVIAEHKRITPIIVINKCDLEEALPLAEIYRRSGYEAIITSAKTGEGVERVREFLKKGTTVFTGNSGVGKSSLINRLFPNLGLTTGAISQKIGRGRHTTRAVELFKTGEEAYIADTPGFSSFDLKMLENIKKDELCLDFPEFEPFAGKCRFTGCSHIKEDGCVIRQAVADGDICESRFDSYARIYESLKNVNEWDK